MCSKPKMPEPAPRYQGGHAPTYSETGSKTGRSSTILTGGDGVRRRGPVETAAAGATGGRDAAMSPTMAAVKKTLLGV